MIERERCRERLEIGSRIVLFIGAEGSGKTTIAKRLASEFEKPYITTGDILRDLAANDLGVLGQKCKAMFNDHVYLDGETLLEILAGRLAKEDTVDGFVLDGGLRTLEESVDFQKMLLGAGRDLPLTVVYLDAPRGIVMKRLLSRGRPDDTPEGIDSRLEKFFFQLEERIAVIEGEESWELIEIDASLEQSAVYDVVKRMITT